MAHVQKKRPFPKDLFTQLTKTECEGFIEVHEVNTNLTE